MILIALVGNKCQFVHTLLPLLKQMENLMNLYNFCIRRKGYLINVTNLVTSQMPKENTAPRTRKAAACKC